MFRCHLLMLVCILARQKNYFQIEYTVSITFLVRHTSIEMKFICSTHTQAHTQKLSFCHAEIVSTIGMFIKNVSHLAGAKKKKDILSVFPSYSVSFDCLLKLFAQTHQIMWSSLNVLLERHYPCDSKTNG